MNSPASFPTFVAFAIALTLLFTHAPSVTAQEQTAGTGTQQNASWDTLKTQAATAGQTATEAQTAATTALEIATKFETCAKLGMIYAPGSVGADAVTGCRGGLNFTKCHDRVGGYGVHVYCGDGQVATKVCSSGKYGSCRASAGAIATTGSMTRDGWMGPKTEQKVSGPSTNFTVITCCSLE